MNTRAPKKNSPLAWQRRLQKLVEASRRRAEGPLWFTPVDAYFGNVETRTHAQRYYWDGMQRLGPRDRHHVYFQFTLAGFGHFELYGQPPERVPQGTSFFAAVPSRHRYYLPESSVEWSFGWIGIYHPYLLRRIAKQVAATGPLLRTPANSPLIAHAMRLVRGAFLKDFRDRFEVEQELFEFTLAYERLAQQVYSPEGEALLQRLRTRIVAEPSQHVNVQELAAELGMSRSAFSHYFRARTGLTPAHYVAELRVQEASRLLTTTRLSLEHIASACGFANANHFGKVFRRFRHQSAGVYRNLTR